MTLARPYRMAVVGLQHSHLGTLDPAKPSGLLGTFRALAGAGMVELVALCEPHDAARLDHEAGYLPGISTFGDVRECVAHTPIDLALIAGPAVDVARDVQVLAERGIHCFVEKSPARTAREWVPVVEASRRTGAHILVHYPWRHHPAIRLARDWFSAGQLGRPTAMHASMTTGQVGHEPFQRSPDGWWYRPETEGGGMLHWLGAHFVEVMCALFGDVAAVSATCAPVIGNLVAHPRMDDVSAVTLRFINGAIGTLHVGYLNGAGGESRDFLRAWGTHGDVWWPSLGSAITVARRDVDSGATIHETVTCDLPERPGTYGNRAWLAEIAEGFVTGIASGTRPEVGAEEALRVLQIIDAAYESSETRRTIDL
jgi:predicted dehydrogenase